MSLCITRPGLVVMLRRSTVIAAAAAACGLIFQFRMVLRVYGQPPGVDFEVLRNNLQLAQTGLVVVTAASNMVLTLARGEERAESLMRDMLGIAYATAFGILNRYPHTTAPAVDAAVHLNVVLRGVRHKIDWKINDLSFTRRIAPTRMYTVVMLCGENTERRALLAARWLWYNFNLDVFLLSPAHLQKGGVAGSTCNCLFYKLEADIEQWLAEHFASVFVAVSQDDDEYLRLPCAACCLAYKTMNFMGEQAAGPQRSISLRDDLLLLPNCTVLDSYEWLRILRDLVVINDEVWRGATGFTSKQLVDGLDPSASMSTRMEATHTSKITLGIIVECGVSLLLCAFVKIVPYLSTVIARRLVRSIVTGMTSKTAMIMPPGDVVWLMSFQDGFPGVTYTSAKPTPQYWKDRSYPVFAAGLSTATVLACNMLWALSLGGYIPAVVGEKRPVQASVFNVTVVIIGLSIWLAGASWRLWKGTTPSSLPESGLYTQKLRLKVTLQLALCTSAGALVALLALCFASTPGNNYRALGKLDVGRDRFWVVCACCSLVIGAAFTFIDSLYFLRSPNTSVPEPGTTIFQFSHICSQTALSLITGNIF